MSRSDRLGAIDWSQYRTAYARADGPHARERRDGTPAGRWGSVPDQLARLWDDDPKTRLKTTHHLWCGLCHRHAYVSSAALPAMPFLLERLDGADDELAVELLDIVAGIAGCVAVGAGQPDGPWLQELRRVLLQSRARFEQMSNHSSSDLASWAGVILVSLDAIPHSA